jgi:CysZ protein
LRNRAARRMPAAMIRALVLSLGQLGDRAILGVLARSLAVTLALFVLIGAGAWWLADALIARASGAHHGALAGVAATVTFALLLWFAFRAVAVAVVGVFADAVVEAVERRHYPAAIASAKPVPLARALATGVGSAARFVGLNLLLLPAYLALLVTGIGTAALFFAVNAWLLGRDLGDMVAARHLSSAAMRDWRKVTGARRFLLGLAGTGLFVVPGLNVLAPVLGAAMATHLFHGGRK